MPGLMLNVIVPFRYTKNFLTGVPFSSYNVTLNPAFILFTNVTLDSSGVFVAESFVLVGVLKVGDTPGSGVSVGFFVADAFGVGVWVSVIVGVMLGVELGDRVALGWIVLVGAIVGVAVGASVICTVDGSASVWVVCCAGGPQAASNATSKIIDIIL